MSNPNHYGPGPRGGQFAPRGAGDGLEPRPAPRSPRVNLVPRSGLDPAPHQRPIHPWKALADDAEVREAAKKAVTSLPLRVQYDVEDFLRGVIVGEAPYLEKHTEALHEAFAPARDLIRKKYGDEVTLYRGEPEKIPAVARQWLSWSPNPSLAAGFSTRDDHHLVGAKVKVDDLHAILLSPHNRNYVEYLARDRPAYHANAKRLPWSGHIELRAHGPHTEAEVERLRRTVARHGGELVKVRVRRDEDSDTDEKRVTAHILLPRAAKPDEFGHVHLDDEFSADVYHVFEGASLRGRRWLP